MIREAVRGDLEGLMALYAQLHDLPPQQPGCMEGVGEHAA